MPANLPPEYYRKEKELQKEKDPNRKIEILTEMLAVMPKHKGTDKLQALLRAKIAKLRKELKKKKKVGARYYEYSIPKEGAGQAALVGFPNSGKSSILKALTNASPRIGSYPFTTTKPEVGMIEYEDVRIQLVDLPPITEDTPGWIFGIIRNSDLIIIVIDLAQPRAQELMSILRERNITPENHRFLAIANKSDLVPNYPDLLPQIPTFKFSTLDPDPEIKGWIFHHLGVIRIYTKKPREKFIPSEPLIMKEGATVMDAACHLKRDFKDRLKYARIWREGMKGMRVERTFPLQDKDIVELHF
ncbi:GTP-binding protein HSR1 [candidate division WOR-3 bacterium]|uniref:GTP-binding protein HSR1 n=1 Tax=candidate division WOR-3 bacterium TaxID=2052148 RepID=A0A660SKW8_UNCW3|nr:MAG: GTP-binding protein HSR1 [candidate division WOR-3 bacterium]